MPDIPKYDGTSDPQEHITTYTMTVKVNDLVQHEIEYVLLKTFGETLTKGALTWYSLFPEHSIDSFEMLVDSFIKAHGGARKVQERKPYERTDGPGNKGFQSSDRFASYKRADHGRISRSLQEKEASGSRDSPYPRLYDYKFNISLVVLVSAMRNIKEAMFLKPIRLDPSQRNLTGDCRHLREKVTTLLKNVHLKKCLGGRAKNNYGRYRDVAEPSKPAIWSPWMMINMIFGQDEVNGVTFSAAKKTKIWVTHGKRIREVSEDDITFTEEDGDRLLLPHNDALVIFLNILDFKIKRVLVDPGSSANIIQWRVLEQAKLIGNIILETKLLARFNISSVTTRGEILLPTHADLFEVVDGNMGYNGLSKSKEMFLVARAKKRVNSNHRNCCLPPSQSKMIKTRRHWNYIRYQGLSRYDMYSIGGGGPQAKFGS
ncbi:uncharacterized protein [Nicotiana tomentosiformis]|uniref:uncharacterized protein n=1 Tax=Nicotiana tomentosiformis TaxID=4098 RepID=UPI00388C3839